MHNVARAKSASPGRRALWPALAATLAFALALVTLQTQVNGSTSPYATDVGEIQNALPRWGTLHFTGYPLYSVTGSLIVTLLRLGGVAPAAGASLVSAAWGAVAVGLLTLLAMTLGASGAAALGGSLIAALSLSAWIDASLAEVHTMTMALSVASLLLALRFRRSGARGDLLWLTLALTQGVAHQRAVAFLAPALIALVAPRWRTVRLHLGAVAAVALLAPLSYLYLPVRAWQGAEWTFGQPGTWRGFWAMIADTKAERILAAPATPGEWWERVLIVVRLIGADLPLPLLGVGLAGLWALPTRSRQLSAALTLAWLPYLALCVVIWEGDVSDALLAVKLPISFLAGAGLATLVTRLGRRHWAPRLTGLVALATIAACLGTANYPRVTAITRDRAAAGIIDTVAALDAPKERPATLMVLWGHEYWALRYAQTYEGRFPQLALVDHNADMGAIVASGRRLWTPVATFYRLPPATWEERLGAPVHLSSVGPGVVEISTAPVVAVGDVAAGPSLALGDGLHIASATLRKRGDRALVTVYWTATGAPTRDYSVGVHLLTASPPDGPDDIAAQADQSHPVGGWFPTTAWETGEVVRDDYVLAVPPGCAPVGVRVGLYHQADDGSFVNSPWLYLAW